MGQFRYPGHVRLRSTLITWVPTLTDYRLALFGSYGNLLTCATFREGWFDSNIWSPLIDHCLLGLDGIVVQRYVLSRFHYVIRTPVIDTWLVL